MKTVSPRSSSTITIFADLERLKNDIHRCDHIGVEDTHTKPQPDTLRQAHQLRLKCFSKLQNRNNTNTYAYHPQKPTLPLLHEAGHLPLVRGQLQSQQH